MTRICSIFFVFFILISISYAQLLETQQKRSIFDKHVHFKYYNEIVKKETGRTLNQLAHDSKTSFAKGFSITFSETELQAINMVLIKHKNKSSTMIPFKNLIFVYKVDSEILYIHIGTERIKGEFVKGGGDSEFLVDLNKMSIIDEWINQK